MSTAKQFGKHDDKVLDKNLIHSGEGVVSKEL